MKFIENSLTLMKLGFLPVCSKRSQKHCHSGDEVLLAFV